MFFVLLEHLPPKCPWARVSVEKREAHEP